MLSGEQEKVVEALSLHGKGFALSRGVQLVRDGYGRHFLVHDDGTTEGPLFHRGPIRTLRQIEREVYDG